MTNSTYKKEDIELFLILLNKIKPSINNNSTIEEKYTLLGVKTNNNYLSINELQEILQENSINLIKENAEIETKILYKLRQYIIITGLIEKRKEYYFHLDTLLTIIGFLGHEIKFVPELNNPIWNDIIKYAKNYLILSNVFCQIKKEIFKKEIQTAKSIIFLNLLGSDIQFNNLDIVIKNKKKVLQNIEHGIKKIGGQKFLKIFFEKILYVSEFERFLIIRQGNQPIQSDITIEIPHGFLLNLAIKNIDKKGDNNVNVDIEYEKIIEISKNYCFVQYSVQNYSIWEDILHISKDSLEYFNDLVIKNTLFEIPQFQAKYAKEFCNYIITKEEVAFKNLLKYNLSDLQRVINYLFDITDKRKIKTFFLIKLVKELSIELEILKDIISDLSQNSKEINKNYFEPTDYSEVTFWQKPLIRKPNGEYILLPKSIIGFSFYEAVTSILRNLNHKSIDNNIGYHFEDFVKEQLKNKHIKFSCGKYLEKIDNETIEGEADILLEFDSSILLFECKKKSLTRNSKSGSAFSILMDLTSSILDSQLQCFKTDSILRLNDKILLKDNLIETEVNLNSRNIEKFTFTLTDYGIVQDRIITGEILKEFIKYTFTIADENNLHIDASDLANMKKRIDNLAKKQSEFKKYIDMFEVNNQFFNSAFINLHQFLFCIENSENSAEFYDEINNTKYVSMGSFDFYQEYFMKNLLYKYYERKKFKIPY